MTKYAPKFWNKEAEEYQDLIPFDNDNSGTPGLVPTAKKVQEIDSTVNKHITSIENLTGSVSKNAKDISALKTSVGDVNVTDLKGQVSTNETNISALKTSVGDVNVTELKGQVGTNTTSINALNTSVSKNVGDIQTLQGKVTTNETNISTLNTSVSKNVGDIQTLQGKVGNINVTDLKGQVDDNEKDIETLQGSVSKNTEAISALKTNVENITDGTTTVGLAKKLTIPSPPEGQSSSDHYFLNSKGEPVSATASGTISMSLSQDLPQSFQGYSFDVFNTIQPTLNNGVIGLTSTSGKIKIPVASSFASGLVQSGNDLTFAEGKGTVANLNLSSVTVNNDDNVTLQSALDDTYLKKSGDTSTGPLNFLGTEASALLTYTDNSNSSKDICSIYPDDNWLALGNTADDLYLAGNKLSLVSSTPISVTQPIEQTYYRFSQKYQSNTGSNLTNDKVQVNLSSTNNEAYIPMQLQTSSGISNCLSPRSIDNASSLNTLTNRGIKVQRTGYYLISGVVRFHTLPSGAEQRIGVELVIGTDEDNQPQMASFNSIGVPSTITVSSVTIPPYPVELEAGEYVGLRASLPHGASGAIGGLNTYGYTSLTFQLIG